MRIILLPFTAALAIACQGQVLLSDSLLQTLSAGELGGQGIPSPQYGVSIHKLVYATTDAFGAATAASGALVLPNAPWCDLPLFAYDHGTVTGRNEVPSRLSYEILVGKYMGSSGFVSVLPDYLGLGDSPGMHPYIHAVTEATATIDMLRAAREYCSVHGIGLNGEVFLAGYSQGGHAAMATHRMIQEQFPDEFNVVASAPCSGPYDCSGVQASVITADESYPAPYYLPYILLAYKDIYPGLPPAMADIFVTPYDTLLPPLFDGTHSSGDIDAVMPDTPNLVVQPALLAAYMSDPDHPFRMALRDNDVYDWAPAAPMRLNYCSGDHHVFYMNSIVARDTMLANGATGVTATDLGPGTEHQSCALPALSDARDWFISLRTPCAVGEAEHGTNGWQVAYDPDGRWTIRSTSRNVGGWWLRDALGRVLEHGTSGSAPTLVVNGAGLPPGKYHLTINEVGGGRTNMTLMRLP